jgi:hypothetical protein
MKPWKGGVAIAFFSIVAWLFGVHVVQCSFPATNVRIFGWCPGIPWMVSISCCEGLFSVKHHDLARLSSSRDMSEGMGRWLTKFVCIFCFLFFVVSVSGLSLF